MKGDVRDLQDEMIRQAAQQDAQLRALTAQIQALQDTLDVQSDMVVDTRGGIARELRDIQTSISQLTALTGQIQRSVVQLNERLRAGGAGVTTRADPDSLLAFGSGGAAACEETYEAAMTQLGRGSLNTARLALRSVLADCSDDDRLSASAQFFLADIFEQENRLDEAIEEFLRVPELHPTSDRVPVALYRIGNIYVLQSEFDEAAIYLERVVATYPESGAAELAQELLQEIR
jgi:TolA-binding protein